MADRIIDGIKSEIITPLMFLLFGAALVLFLWGGFQFIMNADSDEGREVGKRHLIWGIVGMVIMISVYGILNIALNTFGISR